MISWAKRYRVFLLFVYLTLAAILTSRYVAEWARIPLAALRVITLLSYLPYALFALKKFLDDIKYRSVNFLNCCYYLFAAYYGALFLYRLFTGMEAKENLYFAIIFFGSAALFLQLMDGRLCISREEYIRNLSAVCLYMILYRLFWLTVGIRIWLRSPINDNISSGMVALLVPFIADCLHMESGRREKIKTSLLLCATFIVILTTGARVIFWLTAVLTAAMLLSRVQSKPVFLRLFSAILCAAVVVAGLMEFDVGRVRYSVFRELNMVYVESQAPAPGESPGEEPPGEEPPSKKPSNDPAFKEAQEQIERADSMRGDLVRLGMEQIRLNPVFGTGDVLFDYEWWGIVYQQTSHNFLIESMICFGAAGTVILMVIAVAILIRIKIFSRENHRFWPYKLSAFLTIFFFMGQGFVEPIFYDRLMSPLFFIILSFYGHVLTREGFIINDEFTLKAYNNE